MAETRHRALEPSRAAAPALTYLGPGAESALAVRPPAAARGLVEAHRYLLTRVADRLAACWPPEVDIDALLAEAEDALQRVAVTVERPEEMAPCALEAVASRMRQVLAAGEWYRRAMLGHARPLTDTWRGLVLAGRAPSDQSLCWRLHLSPAALVERFVQFALVFTIEPGALLPADVDAKYAVAEIVATLPAPQQLTAALYYHQELTFPEIARVMGLASRQTQELFGRAAANIAAEAALPFWRAGALTA